MTVLTRENRFEFLVSSAVPHPYVGWRAMVAKSKLLESILTQGFASELPMVQSLTAVSATSAEPFARITVIPHPSEPGRFP
jgi:hypothetical protein